MDYVHTTPAYVDETRDVASTGGVYIRGGTNWDFSRKAVETPVEPYDPAKHDKQAQQKAAAKENSTYSIECQCGSDGVKYDTAVYKAGDSVPKIPPSSSIYFGLQSSKLSTEYKQFLKSIPQDRAIVIAGHGHVDEMYPAELAQKRVLAVEAYLRMTGHTRILSDSFGANRPVTGALAKQDGAYRRVDVWISPEKK